MITLGIWGPGEDITQDRTIEMLTAFVPTAVRTLGGDASETAPSGT